MWAIREGHIAIVQALLADTTVDATIKDNVSARLCPLLCARVLIAV